MDQAAALPAGRSHTSLNKVVEGVCQSLSEVAREKGIRVETHLAPDLPEIGIASRALNGCIAHLVANALEAIVPEAPTRAVSVETRKSGSGWVALSVTDSGPGMTAEVQQELFKPFFTTKGRRRAGLGLAMAHRIVEKHGGRIEVDSHPGRGSTFTLLLPTVPSTGPG
jgi:two-component system NtrC family sensor kinase